MELDNMDSHKRSVAKSLSWRFIATFITAGVVFFITEEFTLAAIVGLGDTTIKFFAYYFHERLWNRIQFGRPKPPAPPEYQI
jgi:uncharacterized membrane protein